MLTREFKEGSCVMYATLPKFPNFPKFPKTLSKLLFSSALYTHAVHLLFEASLIEKLLGE